VVSTPPEGVVPPATLSGVAPGSNWFSVAPPSGAAARLLPTLQPMTIAVDTITAPLVAVDRDQLDLTAQSLFATLDQSAAHAILIFKRGGAPLRGVRVEGAPAGAVVAYDVASGYTADDQAVTSTAGTVLLLNLSTAPIPSLTYDVGSGPVPLGVQSVAGFVTWASLEVP
jgi:hypothetical protein